MVRLSTWHAACKYELNTHPIMKTLLRFISLVTAAGFPCLAFAELAGARLPASVNAETTLAVFASSSLLLIALFDYTRRFKTLAPAVERPLRPSLRVDRTTFRPQARLAA